MSACDSDTCLLVIVIISSGLELKVSDYWEFLLIICKQNYVVLYKLIFFNNIIVIILVPILLEKKNMFLLNQLKVVERRHIKARKLVCELQWRQFSFTEKFSGKCTKGSGRLLGMTWSHYYTSDGCLTSLASTKAILSMVMQRKLHIDLHVCIFSKFTSQNFRNAIILVLLLKPCIYEHSFEYKYKNNYSHFLNLEKKWVIVHSSHFQLSKQKSLSVERQ